MSWNFDFAAFTPVEWQQSRGVLARTLPGAAWMQLSYAYRKIALRREYALRTGNKSADGQHAPSDSEIHDAVEKAMGVLVQLDAPPVAITYLPPPGQP
jgi:hypothetical protein